MQSHAFAYLKTFAPCSEQCLSRDAGARPPHASELLTTLEALEHKRQVAGLARRYLHMTVFAPKAETLEREFGASDLVLSEYIHLAALDQSNVQR